MLSLISVLGVFIVLVVWTISLMNAGFNVPNQLPHVIMLPQVSAVRNRRSSSKTLFVRTDVAIYFIALLICNLVQAIGGIVNISWIVTGGVYSGVTCTAQGVLKQVGNVRGPFPRPR